MTAIIPLVVTAVVFTFAYLNNKDKHPVIVPEEEKQTDSKASLEDGYSAKEDIYSSKDAKAVIEDFPYYDFMDRPYLPPLPPPPPIHPPCVTEVNPRRCND